MIISMPDTSQCIFCNIISGDLPKYTVYEDNTFLAFLDIFPRVKGHTLVIPKDHHRWVYDVPAFGDYWEVAQLVGKKLQKTLKSEYVSFLTIGNEVPHAHIHILPQPEAGVQGFTLSPVVAMSKEDMGALALQIKNNK